MTNSDEIIDKAQTLSKRLTMWFKALWGLIVGTFPYSAILIAIVLGGIFVTWLMWHGTSENEQDAIDARTEAIKNDANTSVLGNGVEQSGKVVEDAEKTSQKAQDRAKGAREKPKSNVNIQEAMDNCEKVYPGECK